MCIAPQGRWGAAAEGSLGPALGGPLCSRVTPLHFAGVQTGLFASALCLFLGGSTWEGGLSVPEMCPALFRENSKPATSLRLCSIKKEGGCTLWLGKLSHKVYMVETELSLYRQKTSVYAHPRSKQRCYNLEETSWGRGICVS